VNQVGQTPGQTGLGIDRLAGRPGLTLVQLAALWTRVYTRRKVEVVEAIPLDRPAMWLGRLAATW
jgi:hypothetical protein